MPNSPTWGQGRSFPPRVRRRIIRRDGCCVQCGSTDQLEADHVVSHAEAVRLGWSPAEIDDETNGQALCRPCHRRKTSGEAVAARRRQVAARRRPREAHPGLIRRDGA